MLAFGNQIKKIRTDRHLTQQELSDLLNITRTTVSKWEKGSSFPNIVDVKAIAEKLEVSLPYLLEGKEEDETEKHKNKFQAVKPSEPIREYVTFFMLCILSIVSFNNGCFFCIAGVIYSFKKKLPIWLKVLGLLVLYNTTERLLFSYHLIDIPSIITIK